MSDHPAGPGKPSLTLVVPGLFNSRVPPKATPRLPALERLLGRSDRLKPRSTGGGHDGSLTACLFGLFGIARPPEGDFPAAAVSRLADGGERDDGFWLRADPVHLEPAGGGLILTEGGALKITAAEAERLAAEILENYADEGWQLEVRHPLRWYLRAPQATAISTVPPLAAAGRDIHPFLPAGPDAKAWHTLLNETQILLHTSGINSEREARGLLPINSLWFWGAGRLPEIDAGTWTRIWGGDPVALGLARLANIPSGAVPADVTALLAALGGSGEHLVVLDPAQAAAAYGETEAWVEALTALERDWIVPLSVALQAGDLAALNLWPDAQHGFAAAPGVLRRWWRRRRRLTAFR
jgi:hypothetical protein